MIFHANSTSSARAPTAEVEVVGIGDQGETTDPRGGEVVAPTVSNGLTPGTTVEAGPGGVTSGPSGPGAGAPPAPVDVEINAVIVSAAQSPWDAVKRTPGVRNVIVTGGVIALGDDHDGELRGRARRARPLLLMGEKPLFPVILVRDS